MGDCSKTHVLKILGSSRVWTNLSTGQPETDATVIAQLEQQVANEDCCNGKPETWKRKERYVGIENTKTRFSNSYDVLVTLANGEIRPLMLPAGTSWADQMSDWAVAFTGLFPEAAAIDVHWWEWRPAFLPNTGNGAIPASDMNFSAARGQFIQFTYCPGDSGFMPVDVQVIAVNGSKVKPFPLIVATDESETEYLTHCVSCDPDCQEGPPKCAIPAADSFPELPELNCTTAIENGCDDLGTTDPNDNIPIVAMYENCGDGIVVSYFQDDGNGNLEEYPLVGQFIDCDTGEVVEPPEECSLCDFAVECGSGNIWTLFSKLELIEQGAFAGIVQVGDIPSGSGATHPDLGFSINGWNVFAMCADTQPATDSNGHDWLQGAPDSFTSAPFVRSNPDPECGGGGRALNNKICNTDDITGPIVDAAGTHLVQGCIDDSGDIVSAYTIINSSGDALFTPRPLTDLGFVECPTVAGSPVTIYSEEYFARSIDGLTQSANRNAQLSVVRTSLGRWTATLATPHPDDVNYHPSIQPEEQAANRDGIDSHIVQGTQTANGFQFMFTTGDNGAASDNYVDTPFTIAIDSPVEVLKP